MKRRARAATVVCAFFAAIAFLYFQQEQIDSLRQQVLSLRDQLTVSETGRQTAEAQAQNGAHDLKRLHDEQSELPRLRGEVSMLRREVAEKDETLAKLNGAKDSAIANKPSNVSPVTAFGSEARDFGAATPERAATSLIWAATSGQTQRLSELLELPPNIPEAEAPSHYEYFANMLSNNFSRFEFTEINSVRPNADGTLRLGIMYRDRQTGKTNPFPFMMRQRETGWKVVVEGDVPAKL